MICLTYYYQALVTVSANMTKMIFTNPTNWSLNAEPHIKAWSYFSLHTIQSVHSKNIPQYIEHSFLLTSIVTVTNNSCFACVWYIFLCECDLYCKVLSVVDKTRKVQYKYSLPFRNSLQRVVITNIIINYSWPNDSVIQTQLDLW